MSGSLVVLVVVVAAALALLAVVVAVARRRGAPAGPVDRAELQARQRATGQAHRPEHGYGADRTFGGGGGGSA
jgi:flagellar biosynthesis/type III secretory pathway M-ring protein FliF/YscJ